VEIPLSFNELLQDRGRLGKFARKCLGMGRGKGGGGTVEELDRMNGAALLAALPLPVCVIGPDQRVSLANPAAVARFGDAMTGRAYALTFRHPGLVAAIDAALAGGHPDPIRIVLPDGPQEAVFRVRVTPLAPTGADGDAGGDSGGDSGGPVVCAFEDISEQEQIGQMRRDFVANVSHELRTPLTALVGFIETLQGAARDDAAARGRFLGIMQAQAQRMNRLVADLLSLSRVEAQERVRPQDPVDLVAVVRSAVVLLKPALQAAGAQVLVTGDDAPVMVAGDSDQLVQVFSNLIENAVKYGAAGQTVRVEFGTIPHDPALRGPSVRVAISDQGEGIDPVHLPRLTERFYRVDTHRSREKGGTGLGLAIVKHIISRHRGRLTISSETGKGSTFAVHLPRG
jgi:two-component system phosphate regulon sensor histidine kinase PhoR